MGLFSQKITIYGQYFGSYPDYTDTAKTLYVTLSNKGIDLRKRQTKKAFIAWTDVLSFDFKKEVAEGIFTVTIRAKNGDVIIEADSWPSTHGGNTMIIAMNDKLNKCKRFTIEHTRALA
jgi:hypothetical protein